MPRNSWVSPNSGSRRAGNLGCRRITSAVRSRFKFGRRAVPSGNLEADVCRATLTTATSLGLHHSPCLMAIAKAQDQSVMMKLLNAKKWWASSGALAWRPLKLWLSKREKVVDDCIYFPVIEIKVHLAGIVVSAPKPCRQRLSRHALRVHDVGESGSIRPMRNLVLSDRMTFSTRGLDECKLVWRRTRHRRFDGWAFLAGR